jgi:DNA polymerase-3 subunit beta
MLAVEVTESSIRWRMGESLIFSKLIEGPFPKYEQVIPKDNDKRLVVERDTFIQDLRAADAVTDQTSHMVRLALKNGDVRLTAQSADIGGSDVACDGAVYEGEPLTVGYNAHYVLDALGHMSAARAEVKLKTSTGPVLLKELSEKPGTGDYLCLVMPLRLPE